MTVTLAREELASIAPGRDAAVTIGKFDGVHRGHQHLIASLIERARAESLASVVCLQHAVAVPLEGIANENPERLLVFYQQRGFRSLLLLRTSDA